MDDKRFSIVTQLYDLEKDEYIDLTQAAVSVLFPKDNSPEGHINTVYHVPYIDNLRKITNWTIDEIYKNEETAMKKEFSLNEYHVVPTENHPKVRFLMERANFGAAWLQPENSDHYELFMHVSYENGFTTIMDSYKESFKDTQNMDEVYINYVNKWYDIISNEDRIRT